MRKGWESSKIGDWCEVVNGGTPRTGVADYWGGPHAWITPAEMGRRLTPYVSKTTRTLTDAGIHESSAQLLPPLSVILSSRAPIGHLVINRVPMATNQGCKGLVPREDLDHKFLFYYLTSIVSVLEELGTGTTFKELSGSKLKEVPIPVPPLPEQHRIVALLDEAFAGIAKARENTERNLENAREVFETRLQSVFASPTVDAKWTTLGQEIDLLAGYAFKSRDYMDAGDGVRLLRGDNIIQGSIRWQDAKLWPSSDLTDFERYRLEVQDVVLAMDRPWVKAGLKRAVISESDLPCLLVQRTARMRTRSGLDHRFLFHLLASSAFVQHILGVQTGIGVPHISGQQIMDFRFRRPALVEQTRIASLLDSLWTMTTNLTALYHQKLAALDALKQSLLRQAFHGDL